MPRSMQVMCSTCKKDGSPGRHDDDPDRCRCIHVDGPERIPEDLHQKLSEFQLIKEAMTKEGKSKKRKRSPNKKSLLREKLNFHPANFRRLFSKREWKDLILGCYVQSSVLPSKEEKALAFPETIEIPLEPSQSDEKKEIATWTRVVQTNRTAAFYKLQQVPECATNSLFIQKL